MLKAVVIYSDTTEEIFTFTQGKWKSLDSNSSETFDDTLNMIVDCSNGGMTIEFDNVEDAEDFITSINEDISNYTWFIKKGKAFTKKLLGGEFIGQFGSHKEV